MKNPWWKSPESNSILDITQKVEGLGLTSICELWSESRTGLVDYSNEPQIRCALRGRVSTCVPGTLLSVRDSLDDDLRLNSIVGPQYSVKSTLSLGPYSK